MRKDVTKWDLCTLHRRGQEMGNHALISSLQTLIISICLPYVFPYVFHMQQMPTAVLNKAQPAYHWDPSTAKNFCVCHERASPENRLKWIKAGKDDVNTVLFLKLGMFVCFRLGFNGSASWRSSSWAPGVDQVMNIWFNSIRLQP